MKAPLWIVSILLALAFVSACEDDPVGNCADCGGFPPEFLPLTSRKAVLNHLEHAYNTRRSDAIGQLLDDNFTFFLATSDVGGGIPAQWSRADEMLTTMRLFDSNNATTGPIVRSIRMDILFEEAEWTPVVPLSDPAKTWYATTVDYTFTVEMAPDQTYIAVPGAQAVFVVRDIDPSDATDWRLVEWRDLGGNVAATTSTGSESRTWGAVKALYLPSS